MEDITIEPAVATKSGTPAPKAGTPVVELRGIGRHHPREDRWLLSDMSFSLNWGERLGLVGPSGSGKTLLLRAMARLDRLDSGMVYWRGQAVWGNLVPLYRSQVIYLHQRPVLFDGTVEDNLRLPYTLKCHHGRTLDRQRAIGILKALGRDPGFLDQPSHGLSGGEAQLAALVRALQLEPQVLLLDEPTASLDPVTTVAVEQVVTGWLSASATGRAYIWVSHDREQVERMSERLLTLRAGRLDLEV
jgi:putative ABC transport system ATP-binding protein